MIICGVHECHTHRRLGGFVGGQRQQIINERSVTPAPLRKVRRSMAGFIFILDSPVCKQVTGDDLGDDGAYAIIVLGDLNH